MAQNLQFLMRGFGQRADSRFRKMTSIPAMIARSPIEIDSFTRRSVNCSAVGYEHYSLENKRDKLIPNSMARRFKLTSETLRLPRSMSAR